MVSSVFVTGKFMGRIFSKGVPTKYTGDNINSHEQTTKTENSKTETFNNTNGKSQNKNETVFVSNTIKQGDGEIQKYTSSQNDSDKLHHLNQSLPEDSNKNILNIEAPVISEVNENYSNTTNSIKSDIENEINPQVKLELDALPPVTQIGSLNGSKTTEIIDSKITSLESLEDEIASGKDLSLPLSEEEHLFPEINEKCVQQSSNLKEEINEAANATKQNSGNRILKAPPPSPEVGSVLVEKIIPVGFYGDLISYNKSSKPSSSYYVAPAKVSASDCGIGEKLPAYDYPENAANGYDYFQDDLGVDAGPQEYSSLRPEMKPLFDKSDFVPASRWLDLDYSYSTYLKKPLTGNPEDIRTKFNFDDYETGLKTVDKNVYLKILETIDAIPNLGVDPKTMNAFWVKETILRILERNGKYQTKYYDKQGNEYSLRSSKPSYALADWAKEYLSTEKPPNFQEPKLEPGQLFQQVDKSVGEKGKKEREMKMQSAKISKGFKRNKSNDDNESSNDNESSDDNYNKSEQNNVYNKTKTTSTGINIHTKRKGKLNIIPEERQEEIYNALTSGSDPTQALQSLFTPENQKAILEEAIKPNEFLNEQFAESSEKSCFKKSVEPDLENVYEILLGDDIEEKKAIYEMMKTPVGKEKVYEALCRIGAEKYPEFYESYGEDEGIYPEDRSKNKIKQSNELSTRKKREKREIVIQTPPYPDDMLSIDKSALREENLYDSDDIEHNPEKQEHIFQLLKMSDELNPQNYEHLESVSQSKPLPLKDFRQEEVNIEKILSSIDRQNVIYDMLRTSDGRQKVFDALCHIGKSKHPESYET